MNEGRTIALGPCFLCRNVFAFDAELVPSVPIDPRTGLTPDLGGDPERAERQPICERCIREVNRQRIDAGREPWPIPEGAYP